jgi:L-cysteine desulfidase
MIKELERQRIIFLIKSEVVPAIGCTEPMAVALCVAKATEILGCKPQHIEARLSANILKNAMGVGIPGTGMVGLPIAIALGALIGKIDDDVDKSIHNLTSIGADAMNETDKMVLNIMTNKTCH